MGGVPCGGSVTGRPAESAGVTRGSGRGIAAEEAHLLAVPAERDDRVGHGAVLRATLHVDVEEVVPEPPLARARLDPREVHAAERELAQAAHEPARRLVARAGEDDRRLPWRWSLGRDRRRAGAREPHEPRGVVGLVVDAVTQ